MEITELVKLQEILKNTNTNFGDVMAQFQLYTSNVKVYVNEDNSLTALNYEDIYSYDNINHYLCNLDNHKVIAPPVYGMNVDDGLIVHYIRDHLLPQMETTS